MGDDLLDLLGRIGLVTDIVGLVIVLGLFLYLDLRNRRLLRFRARFGGLEGKFVLLFDVFDKTALVEVVAPQLLDRLSLLVMCLDPALKFVLGVLYP